MKNLLNRIRIRGCLLWVFGGLALVAFGNSPEAENKEVNYRKMVSTGVSAMEQHQYERAKTLLEGGLAHIPSDSTELRGAVLKRLRNLHIVNLKDPATGVKYGKSLVELIKRAPGGEGGKLYEAYSMVANGYSRLRDTVNVRVYADSTRLALESEGVTAADRVKGLRNIGVAYKKIVPVSEIAAIYKECVDISRKNRLASDLLAALNMYANALAEMEDYETAINVYKERYDLTVKLLGPKSEDAMWAGFNYAYILGLGGKVETGVQFYLETAAKSRGEIAERLRYLPSEQRVQYTDRLVHMVSLMIPYAYTFNQREGALSQSAYESLLLTKGLYLASERGAAEIVAAKGSAEDQALLEKLNKLHLKLTEEESRKTQNLSVISGLASEIKELDERIASSCAAYGDIASFGRIDYQVVTNSLKEGEVLLDFSNIRSGGSVKNIYCFEIRRGQRYPRLHKLFKEDEVYALLKEDGGDWSRLYSGEGGESLRTLIGEKLRGIIGGAQTVYYVPAGMTHKIALEAIEGGDGLLGDRYRFKRLSSARELLNPKREYQIHSACLYGGLDYGDSPQEGMKEGNSRSVYGELKHSLTEVEGIRKELGRKRIIKMFTGGEGSKESLLGIAGSSPDLLHISTHGYYYPTDSKGCPVWMANYKDPLMMSGLIMSGGNLGWTDKEPGEGILNGSEISRCDFSNVKLVGLASCYSGDGPSSYEGIFGLQRAFKKAGAGSILMNLWEASDKATACFMSAFYKELLNGSRDRHVAFEKGRGEVRKRFVDPYYWAGFVLID